MAESGNNFVGADTSIYNRLMQPAQPVDPLGQADKVVQFQRQSNALDMDQLNKHTQHLQFIAGQIAPMVALGDKITPEQITKGVMDTVTSSGGTVPPEEASQFLSRIMTYPGGPAAGLKATQIQVLSGLERANAIRGNTIATPSGGGTNFSQQDLYSGKITPSPGQNYVPNTMSVAERMQGVQTFQNGQKGTIPASQLFDDYGRPRNALMGAAAPNVPMPTSPAMGAGAPATMAPRGVTGTPSTVVPSLPSANPPPPPLEGAERYKHDPAKTVLPGQVAQAGQPPMFIPTDAPLGTTGSVDMLNQHRQAAANFQADVQPLQKAIPLLEQLGTTGTGPGTERLNDIKSLALSLGVPGAGNFTDSVKAYDETRKYLLQNAMKGDTATNDKLASAIAGNPSVHMSNAAAVDVAKSALALRRMQQTQYLTNAQPGQEASYADRAAKWNSQQDPRAYAVDMMSPQAKQALIKSLGAPGSPAYERFKASLQAAHDAGVISGQ